MLKLYQAASDAIESKDKGKLSKIADSLSIDKLFGSDKMHSSRSVLTTQTELEEEDYDAQKEKEDQSRMLGVKKSLEQFIKKFSTNVPDPIVNTLVYLA